MLKITVTMRRMVQDDEYLNAVRNYIRAQDELRTLLQRDKDRRREYMGKTGIAHAAMRLRKAE